MPFTYGCVNPSTAFAAIAASIALPPASNNFAPACEARNCDVATMPYFVTIMERACSRAAAGEFADAVLTDWRADCAGESSWPDAKRENNSARGRNFMRGF